MVAKAGLYLYSGAGSGSTAVSLRFSAISEGVKNGTSTLASGAPTRGRGGKMNIPSPQPPAKGRERIRSEKQAQELARTRRSAPLARQSSWVRGQGRGSSSRAGGAARFFKAGGDLGQTIGEQLPTLPAALNSHQGRASERELKEALSLSLSLSSSEQCAVCRSSERRALMNLYIHPLYVCTS
jgi:hypothetical protein